MIRLSKHPYGYIHKPSGIIVRKVKCSNGPFDETSPRSWGNHSIHWTISKGGKYLDSALTLKIARKRIDALQT